jgi:hypothetical protein
VKRALLALPLLLAACGPAGLPGGGGPGADVALGAPEADGAGMALLETGEAGDDAAGDEQTQVAAAGPRGFFGALFSGGAGSGGSREAALGTPLPFGEVASACTVAKREMGKRIDKLGRWQLYDTNPNTTAPRPMYLTGFKDGCARQFTAALALFGSAAAHETVRYTLSSPYSETDEAYEQVKARICGVRRGSPCPADRIERMEREVSFVTAYPGFGAAAGPWLEMMLYDGSLSATAVTRR